MINFDKARWRGQISNIEACKDRNVSNKCKHRQNQRNHSKRDDYYKDNKPCLSALILGFVKGTPNTCSLCGGIPREDRMNVTN